MGPAAVAAELVTADPAVVAEEWLAAVRAVSAAIPVGPVVESPVDCAVVE